ncbi:MAG: hypothetical protein P1U47_05815 [Zhongshania sp.]|uniref:hypothetical protein n=1 Tax=Zhongshania sp. TaxID=1971902 RepID=UPI00261C8783|nr:hypothetical protein [Zhongshania sp.]MDF1691866.1 hypothetical protein [Zhongshania sp.]
MNKLKNTLAVAGLALLCSSASYSQVPNVAFLTNIGSALSFDAINAPSLGSLPIGLESLSGAGSLPGLGALPLLGDLGALGGGLEGIPVLGPALAYIVGGDFLPSLLPTTTELTQLAGGQAVVTSIVFGAIGEPQAVLSTVNELGVNAGTAAAPVLAVLLENPAGLVDYFVAGGTILTTALDGTNGGSIAPGIPIVTMAFPLSL